MHFDAAVLLREACERHSVKLEVLVAETGLWASPEVHRRLVAENGTGAYFPGTRRYRAGAGEKRADLRNGERLDDNSYANHALKRALGLPRGGATGFEVCHVWAQSCYDARCHTVVANLVLLPRPLAGLTDHDENVAAALRFRAFELYGWHPPDVSSPIRPSSYPENWRTPMPFTPAVIRSLASRRAIDPRSVKDDSTSDQA